MRKHLNVGHRVECRNPPDEELARKGIHHEDAFPQQRHKCFDVEVFSLRDDVLHKPIEKLHAGLDLRVGVGRQLE